MEFAAALRSNSLVRNGLCALGLTVLYLYWILRPIQDVSLNEFYHWPGSAGNFYGPFLLMILAVWLPLTAILQLVRKPGRLRIAVWTMLILCLSCVFIKLNIFYHRFDSEPWALGIATAVAVLLALIWRPSIAERFERILKPITTVLMFLGLFGGFIVLQLSWGDLRGSLFAPKAELHHRNVVATIQTHRIIWIVFDELSHQQTFEHRYPGLQLPAFDALASGSTVFTNATPFYIRTEEVLPGLLDGKPFDKIRKTSSNTPSLHDAATGQWLAFDQHDTVFQDALNAGYSTALVGWFNPYCRMIPAVLDSCFWAFNYPFDTMLPSGTVRSNTRILALQALRGVATVPASSISRYLVHFLPPRPKWLTLNRDSQIQDYQDLQPHVEQLLRDPSYSFVLLHLPVPHPLGIYDRHTHQFTTGDSSYIDNLALADSSLADIVRILKQTNQWDSSTIVLMSDHGWRTKQVWKPLSGWTQEDKIASHGGQYDPRPVYLVKLPNQTTAARIDAPYQTVNTRKLFDAIMAHQINTPTDLTTWAQTVH